MIDRHRASAVPINESTHDDLDDYLSENLRDPEFRAAYEDAAARSALLRALIAKRKADQISQGAVAAHMGTTQSAVSELESGATDPRLSTLQRYARSLGSRVMVYLTTGLSQAEAWVGTAGIRHTAANEAAVTLLAFAASRSTPSPGAWSRNDRSSLRGSYERFVPVPQSPAEWLSTVKRS